ncbi:phosphatidate cytidylyltransferase [Zoogloea sp.]|uniref:phosphatidate cytidylyltransferase n=1 Tax=Zoogloea sp. TaxID=49181 RepID=UPI0026080ACE|nr:phosphatidate cytidylyltransferase [Zoogloea sp.]
MLKARVITALLLLAGLLSAVFLLPAFGWLVFVSVVCGAAAAEWGGIVGFSVVRQRVYALLLGLICLAGGLVAGLHREETVAPFSLIPVYAVSALFWILCAPFWLRARWALSGNAASAIVGVVLLLPPSLAMAHLRLLSPWLLLGVMAAVWVADIAAYFTGRAFGRRKLAPSISPGKSWEGAYGAVVGVVIYGFLCLSFTGHGVTDAGTVAVIVGALVAFTAISIMGDLFESMLKRQAGVKDSGTLLPGHGGILDRIDSLTSTLPFAGLLVLWFAR